MRGSRRFARCPIIVGFLVVATLLALPPAGARGQGSFYMEVHEKGTIYVFNLMKVYQEWRATGEMSQSIIRADAGPDGQTIIFDSPQAIHMYNFKHDLPGEVIDVPEQPPRIKIGWKDGKTTFETDRVHLALTNRVQFRYTGEQPDGEESRGSFRIRRAKTKLAGWFYTKALTYGLQLNWADTASSLEDAYVKYDLTRGRKGFQIKGGQFKVPFGRQELTSSGKQQFVDRSIVSVEFAKGRDLGLQFSGQTPGAILEWRTGLFNGNGRNSKANDNDSFQFDARVTWQPWGEAGYSESDFESKGRPLLAISAGYERNDRRGATAGNDADRMVFGGDVVFKYHGMSLFSEYFRRVSQPEIGPEFDSTGYTVQLGYFVYRRHVEVVVRYATIDPRDNTVDAMGDTAPTIANDHLNEQGIAVNWFMNQHRLKLQADYRRIEDELADATDDEARLQMQFIF